MANVVLAVIPSDSSDGTYDICHDTASNRIWCRITGTDRPCPQWGFGWKRRGLDYHTCKHVERAKRLYGIEAERIGDAEYLVHAGVSRAPVVTPFYSNANPPRVARVVGEVARAARTARPASTYVPSLEQVRKAVPTATNADIVQRGPRRRLEGE